MCKRNGESVDHLLLHCNVAYTLWSASFTRLGLSWVMRRRIIDLFACWWTSGRPRSVAIWKMVPTCLLWCVWKERNNRCFEDLERSLEDFFFFSILCIFGWWLLCLLCRLVLAIFLFVFHFIVKCFLLCTFSVAPYAFNKTSLLLIKKNNDHLNVK